MSRLTKISFQHFFLIVILWFFSACNERPKGVLSKSEMTDILVEMHKLDGSLDANGLLYNQNGEKDKYYTALLEKYEISKADFDSSVVWYTKNPKKYTKIYEDVFAQLTLLNEEVKKGKYHPVDSIEFYTVKKNIWNKETRFVYSKDSIRTRLGFEIKDSSLLFGDVYILRFLQQIAPQDSSKNPQIIFRINYANGKVDSVIQKTHNDSLLRRFTFRIPVRKKLKIKSISGELLSSSVYKGTFHARLDSISLIREYRSDLQDSLRNMVEKADPKKYNSQKKQQPDSILKVKKVSPPKKKG